NLNNQFVIAANYPVPPSVIAPAVVDAYDASDYPPLGDMPLSGYLTGSYYDPAHSADGMLLAIVEVGAILLAVVVWCTYDSGGFAFWLPGAAPLSPGDTEVTTSLASKFGGALARNVAPANLAQLDWGNITISFPNCNSLHFAEEATHRFNGL